MKKRCYMWYTVFRGLLMVVISNTYGLCQSGIVTEDLPTIRKPNIFYPVQSESLFVQSSGFEQQTLANEDTVKAVTHLFQRKRKGGTLRAAIGAGLFGAAAGQMASGSSTGNDAGNAIYLLVFGGLAVSGIVQAGEYNAEKLETLLDAYKAGQGLPEKVKSKLKRKDFE
ncbi:MAG: hypothetical protein AAF149_15415 [Bacteroidota bacterium]